MHGRTPIFRLLVVVLVVGWLGVAMEDCHGDCRGDEAACVQCSRVCTHAVFANAAPVLQLAAAVPLSPPVPTVIGVPRVVASSVFQPPRTTL